MAINHLTNGNTLTVVDTDVLIVGAGPAGAALASFLASYGIKGIMITEACSTSTTARANYINIPAFECLRDRGLENEALHVSYPMSEYGKYHRICKSLAGEEIFRGHAFGSDPNRLRDYLGCSPCHSASLAQHRLEPILVKYASQHGFVTKFNTTLSSFVQHEERGTVESIIEDVVTSQKTLVRSKYLCGADGASSLVARSLDLHFIAQPSSELHIGVEIEADLSHLMKTTPGLIHVLTRPDKPQPLWGIAGIARCVTPWTEWTINLVCAPGIQERIKVPEAEMLARVRELIGDDHVEIKIKSHAFWRINESFATQYSSGNVICLGDAVHRHPPHNGLGANTCIQDAFNLAWKLAYVLQHRAAPEILETYNPERQPIGQYVVQRANETARVYGRLYQLLAMGNPHEEYRERVSHLFKEDSEEGEAARIEFRSVMVDLKEELGGLGTEMNQCYESFAVYVADETEKPPRPADKRQHALEYIESSYPGFRLPHAWLTPRKTGPGGQPALVSTKDLCGHGEFTILTGVGGKPLWDEAVQQLSKETGYAGRSVVRVCSIGWGQEYEDTFFNWFEKRGVQKKGCVLVRPDLTVAWRCKEEPVEDAGKRLVKVMNSILGT